MVIFAVSGEEGEDKPAFYPTRRLARQAFDWLVEDGFEPTVRPVRVTLSRQGLCGALNEAIPQ